MKMKSIAALVLVAMVAIFAVQNGTTVDVTFLFCSLSVPRAVLVVLLLAAGFLLGITVSSFFKAERQVIKS